MLSLLGHFQRSKILSIFCPSRQVPFAGERRGRGGGAWPGMGWWVVETLTIPLPGDRRKSRCRPSWDSYMCIVDSDYLQADRDKRFRYFPSPAKAVRHGRWWFRVSAPVPPHLVIACFIFLSVFFFSYGQTRWNPGLKSWRFRNSNHLPEGSANLREAAHARSS